MQDVVRINPGSRSWHFVFGTQPMTQPITGVSIHRPIGFADSPETEVIGPTVHHLVKLGYYCLMVQQGPIPSSFVADRLTDATYSRLGRDRAQISASRFRRVATTKRIPQKVELLFRQLRDPRLGFIHCQLQLCHHDPHRAQSFFRSASTADHHVIGIVDDACSKTFLVPEFLPPKHEATHVEIAEQRADRGSLGGPSTFIPIACIPVLLPTLIRLFDWSLQPHLDQMKHSAIDDAASYRL